MESRLVRSKSNLDQVLKDMLAEEQNKNYLAAQKLKDEANKLKNEIQNLEKKTNKKQQKKETEDVVSMQEEEIKNWRDGWDTIIKDFTDKSDELTNDMKIKHEQEILELEEEFEAEFRDYRESGAIIELRRKEEIFSRQTNYLEAHYLQTERIRLEEQEKLELQKLKMEKLKIQIKKAKTRQEAEKEVLKQKIDTKLDEYHQTIIHEEKVMNQKHKNSIRDLNSEQEKENLTKSGAIKNTATLTKSTSPAASTYSKMRSPTKKMVSPGQSL